MVKILKRTRARGDVSDSGAHTLHLVNSRCNAAIPVGWIDLTWKGLVHAQGYGMTFPFR